MAALADFYRKESRWKDLVSVLSRQAEVEPDPARRWRCCWRWPKLLKPISATAGQATLAYDQALQADEHCLKAIEALERLHRRTQAWERLADVLARKSQVVSDGDLA